MDNGVEFCDLGLRLSGPGNFLLSMPQFERIIFLKFMVNAEAVFMAVLHNVSARFVSRKNFPSRVKSDPLIRRSFFFLSGRTLLIN